MLIDEKTLSNKEVFKKFLDEMYGEVDTIGRVYVMDKKELKYEEEEGKMVVIIKGADDKELSRYEASSEDLLGYMKQFDINKLYISNQYELSEFLMEEYLTELCKEKNKVTG